MPGFFNPKKFLVLGRQLLNDTGYDEDCRVRTAVGRIYYAAFIIALKKIGAGGNPDSGQHQSSSRSY